MILSARDIFIPTYLYSALSQESQDKNFFLVASWVSSNRQNFDADDSLGIQQDHLVLGLDFPVQLEWFGNLFYRINIPLHTKHTFCFTNGETEQLLDRETDPKRPFAAYQPSAPRIHSQNKEIKQSFSPRELDGFSIAT